MTTQLDTFPKPHLKTNLPDIRPGYTVKVYQKIKEGDKERLQVFQGIVIARKHGKGVNATITVRKISQGIGVERIFPIHSPTIEKIEIEKHAKVRRAKLYYLREAKGKKARLRAKEIGIVIEEPEAQTPEENHQKEEPPKESQAP
ncbi:MAG: 50S ribosomal protein L19 [Patescibacteria group bacterium]